MNHLHQHGGRKGIVIAGLIAAALTCATTAVALAAATPWKPVADETSAATVIGQAPGDPARPSAYRAYTVDEKALRAALAAAPLEATKRINGAMLDLPMPDGSLARFRVVESPILGPDVLALAPGFRSYLAQGVDDPTANGRLDFSPYGFHAYLNTQAGAVVINPWRFGEAGIVLSARLADCPNAEARTGCGVEDLPVPDNVEQAAKSATATGPLLRTYRLALLGTDEYFAYFDPAGSAGSAPRDAEPGIYAMAVSVNRVDAIFGVEAAIRLEFSSVIQWWTSGLGDPFPSGNTITGLYNKVQAQLDTYVGSSHYDVGHGLTVVAPTEVMRGVAPLECVCTAYKGGAASGDPNPLDDHFLVGVLTHELGHQFGSYHTFSSDAGCGVNYAAGWQVEPGSGSTIMGYVGYCDVIVQPYADPYYHAKSLGAIHAFRDATTCAVVTATGNTPPVVDAGPDAVVPTGTAFYMYGAASDVDGDVLTSNWETTSLQSWFWDPDYGRLYYRPEQFRSVAPTTNGNVRLLPAFGHLLDGTPSPFETLPTDSTSIQFVFTARDNYAGGGGVTSDFVQVTAQGAPFVVTYPNGGESFHAGQPFTATWTVGGGAIAAEVGVFLYTPNGFTLLGTTANDGSATFTMPCGITSTSCRLWVEGDAGNLAGAHFLDVSNADFTLDGGLPDYVPYTPAGWADAITVSSVDAPTFGSLVGDQTTYLYAAYANNSTAAACGGFAVDIRVDDKPVALWSWGNAPTPGAVWGGGPYTPVVTGGRHTAWFLTDPQNAQPESSETNNGRARQFVWSPATVNPGTQQARSHPPVRDAGAAWLPAGTPLRDNMDGLRLAPAANGWWRAAAVSSTDSWQDADIRLYTPSTGTGNGFDASPLATSATGGAYTDAVISNRNAVGNPVYDVGLLNSSGGASNIGFEYRESEVTLYAGGPLGCSMGAGQMLRMDEVSINPNLAPQFTLELQTSGANQTVWLLVYAPSFTVGGLWQTAMLAQTNAAGRALVPIPAVAGFYGVAVVRHAFEGTAPFTYTLQLLNGLVTDVPTTPDLPLPAVTRIEGAYPNPFNPQTKVQLALRTAGAASVRVYDVQGRLVRTLLEAELPAGRREVTWDGSGDDGRPVPSGVYFVRLKHPDGEDQRRVSLVK